MRSWSSSGSAARSSHRRGRLRRRSALVFAISDIDIVGTISCESLSNQLSVNRHVREFGLPALGVIVLAAGLLQLAMGALKLGRWLRAISVSIVEGMLAGIGLVISPGGRRCSPPCP